MRLSFKGSNFKVKQRIYFGYGALFALMLATGVFNIFKTEHLSDDFGQFDNIAHDALLASEINADMAKTLLFANEYIATRSHDSLERSKKFLNETRAGVAKARTEIQKPERAAWVAQIDEKIGVFETGLTRVTQLYKKRDEIVATKLDAIGPEARKKLSELADDLRSTGHDALASSVAKANEHFLLGRLYVAKFLLDNDISDIERASAELKKAESYSKSTLSRLPGADQRSRIGDVVELKTAYIAAMLELKSLIEERNALRRNAIAENGIAISGIAANIKNSANADVKIVAEDAKATVASSENSTLAMGVISLILAGLIAWAVARSIIDPLFQLRSSMSALAEGDKNVEVTGADRSDEIGDMAKTVGVFKENMIENERLAANQREAEERAAAEEQRTRDAAARSEEEKKRKEEEVRAQQREELLKLADDFESGVGQVIEAVAAAATEMQASARTMSETADLTSQKSAGVAAASEEATTNVQTVASATEELSTSVQEISRQVSESTRIADGAVKTAEDTNLRIQSLADSAQRIGDVISLINDIASQTNLLALNATIEAARAGEAGKGFAVVATEVKSLADQTAKATEEISTQIGGIQSATTDAVQAIGEIGTTIESIHDIAGKIASAMEQQGAATREIANNVQQAASGTQEVSGNIVDVSTAANETGESARQVLSAAEELGKQSNALEQSVRVFLDRIRAA